MRFITELDIAYITNFRQRRKLLGLTLRQVDELTGINHAYLSQLETNKIKNASFKTVTALHNFYLEKEGGEKNMLSIALSDTQDKVIGLFKPNRSSDVEMVLKHEDGYVKSISIGSLGGLHTLHTTAKEGTLLLFGDGKTLSDMKKDPYTLREMVEQVKKGYVSIKDLNEESYNTEN